jgi:hypothetical protein
MTDISNHGQKDQISIQIDRVHYKVEAKELTGEQLRHVPPSPIPEDRDLFLVVPGGQDKKITDHEVVVLHDGMRFFTAPGHINPGYRY